MRWPFEFRTEGLRRAYNGFLKVWLVPRPNGAVHEIINPTDSIAILPYIKDRQEVVLIKQERAAMECALFPDGRILEIPAGRFDVELGVTALALKELQEEVGIRAHEDQLIAVNGGAPLAVCAGVSTERTYLVIAEVTYDQVEPNREFFGCEKEGERIQRILVRVEDLPHIKHESMSALALCERFLRMQREENGQ